MPRTVEVATGNPLVQLPNGYPAVAGDVVELTDTEYADLSATAFDSVLLDRGAANNLLSDLTTPTEFVVPITLAEIEDTDWDGVSFTPGFAGEIVGIEVVATTAATTTADVDLDVDVDGGTAADTLTLTDTALGSVGAQVDSDNIASNNAFADDEPINITASEATTAFTEGAAIVRILVVAT